MDERPLVALLGEDRGHRSHLELDALRPRLDVATARVPTDSGFAVEEHDGVRLVPGSPYADDAAVLAALTVVVGATADDAGAEPHVLRTGVTRP